MMSSCAVLGLIVFFAGRANQGDGGKMRESRIEERERRQNNFLQGVYYKLAQFWRLVLRDVTVVP
jgi:hypothetical protein